MVRREMYRRAPISGLEPVGDEAADVSVAVSGSSRMWGGGSDAGAEGILPRSRSAIWTPVESALASVPAWIAAASVEEGDGLVASTAGAPTRDHEALRGSRATTA